MQWVWADIWIPVRTSALCWMCTRGFQLQPILHLASKRTAVSREVRPKSATVFLFFRTADCHIHGHPAIQSYTFVNCNILTTLVIPCPCPGHVRIQKHKCHKTVQDTVLFVGLCGSVWVCDRKSGQVPEKTLNISQHLRSQALAAATGSGRCRVLQLAIPWMGIERFRHFGQDDQRCKMM